MAIVEFLIDEQEKGVCSSTSKKCFFVCRISNALCLFFSFVSLIFHLSFLTSLVLREWRCNLVMTMKIALEIIIDERKDDVLVHNS